VQLIEDLKKIATLSNHKKDSLLLSSSYAVNKYGLKYSGVSLRSKTNLLSISSEQSSLAHAISEGDTKVNQIVSYYPNAVKTFIAPHVLQIISDFNRRTGSNIGYKIIGHEGEVLFSINSIKGLLPYYDQSPVDIYLPIPTSSKTSYGLLKLAALGQQHAFATYKGASRYGAAVKTADKGRYYSGQYSAFDGNNMIHAEVVAVMLAILNNDIAITEISVISDKFNEEVVNMCGPCRQFIAELASDYAFNPKIHLYNLDGSKHKEYNLEEYLPNMWSVI